MRPVVAVRALACASIAALLSGCSYLGITQDAPRGVDGEVVQAGAAHVDAIKTGDCLNEPGSEEFETVGAIPCGEPHELEMFHAFNVTQDSLPDDAAWERILDECYGAAFTEFAGIAYEDSGLDVFPFAPTDESWAFGDRKVQCLIGEATLEPVTGSLRGAAR
ncbi:septum formation family protein [Zafaria sp. Z1313]|uniref:septum formation family protein n=1 Tax=Zafaria sp. Z1313 TaxID=3423202 RepID=UPI003D302A8D